MVIVVGISFNLIIIRVDKGVAVGETYVDSGPITSIPLSFRSGPRKGANSGVEVSISRDVDYQASSIAKDNVSVGGHKGAWEAV